MRGQMRDWQDPRLIRAASHLSPAVIRVGGITADFVQYTPDDHPTGRPTEPAPPRALPMPMGRTAKRPMKGFWPTGPEGNLSIGFLGNLTDFFAAANLSLMLDLNELHGRDCHTVKPGCPSANPGCHVRASPRRYCCWFPRRHQRASYLHRVNLDWGEQVGGTECAM